MDEELLTPRELADRLKVALSWVYYHTGKRGSAMPVMRIGKHLRFRMSEVLEWGRKDEGGGMKDEQVD